MEAKKANKKYDVNRMVFAFFIFAGIAVTLALASAILFFIGSDFSSAIGVIATVVSLLLSVAAMLYTYFSGTGTLELLNKIESQNKELVAKINQDLLKDAYDEKGIDDLRKSRRN